MCLDSPISALLHTPICTHFMGLGGPLKEAHGDICLLIPTTFQTKVLLMVLTCVYCYFTWVLGPSNGTNEIGPKMCRHK